MSDLILAMDVMDILRELLMGILSREQMAFRKICDFQGMLYLPVRRGVAEILFLCFYKLNIAISMLVHFVFK